MISCKLLHYLEPISPPVYLTLTSNLLNTYYMCQPLGYFSEQTSFLLLTIWWRGRLEKRMVMKTGGVTGYEGHPQDDIVENILDRESFCEEVSLELSPEQ